MADAHGHDHDARGRFSTTGASRALVQRARKAGASDKVLDAILTDCKEHGLDPEAEIGGYLKLLATQPKSYGSPKPEPLADFETKILERIVSGKMEPEVLEG